mgnify:CR=1 FL=1
MAKITTKCLMDIQDNDKGANGRTPFKLTFGSKAIIPVEVRLTSIRVMTYEE